MNCVCKFYILIKTRRIHIKVLAEDKNITRYNYNEKLDFYRDEIVKVVKCELSEFYSDDDLILKDTRNTWNTRVIFIPLHHKYLPSIHVYILELSYYCLRDTISISSYHYISGLNIKDIKCFETRTINNDDEFFSVLNEYVIKSQIKSIYTYFSGYVDFLNKVRRPEPRDTRSNKNEEKEIVGKSKINSKENL